MSVPLFYMLMMCMKLCNLHYKLQCANVSDLIYVVVVVCCKV